ncbi:MAG: Nicotinamidase [Chlamydiae bacterium]|nr:Nicotinamidase [Chlamydiota bacterium]
MSRALLIVDLQNDFLTQGALAVPNSDQIIPLINALMPLFENVYATKDCHPENHVSFASRWNKEVGQSAMINDSKQILWPDHCIKDQWGYQFPDSLNQKWISKEFYKGTDPNVDSYSIFFDKNKNPASKIQEHLKTEQISELFIVGLATDYCVRETVLHALDLGYRVSIIVDGCKGVNIEPGDEEKAIVEMKEKGASLVESEELFKTSYDSKSSTVGDISR